MKEYSQHPSNESRTIQPNKEKSEQQAEIGEIIQQWQLQHTPCLQMRHHASKATPKARAPKQLNETQATKLLQKECPAYWPKFSEATRIFLISQIVEHGIEPARQYIDSECRDIDRKERLQAREAEIAPSYSAFSEKLTHPLAQAIFKAMNEGYIIQRTNLTLGSGPYSQDQVDAAIADFSSLVSRGTDIDEIIKNIHWFRRQDKADLGKEIVGDTLATRGIQANFIATWNGFLVNIHVDIPE